MSVYTVTAVNNSLTFWKFFVYQPPIGGDLTLAWFASPILIPNRGGTTLFNWQTNYQFVWSQTGIVEPGKVIKASGEKNCDPDGANTTTFTFQGGTPVLSDPVPGGDKGTLSIFNGPTIPPHTFAEGIGMSGSATFVLNAGPNLSHTLSIPKPAYYIAAIIEVEQGEVMDVTTITKTAEIPFPTGPGVFNVTATLQADNTWSFIPPFVGEGPQVGQVAKGAKVKQQA